VVWAEIREPGEGGMDLQWRDGASALRFSAYVERLTRALGHADRVAPIGWSGLNVSSLLVWVLPGAWAAEPVGMAQPARQQRRAQTPPEPVAQRGMRPDCIVVPSPAFDHNFGLLQ
jgi:hypothetical protein